MSRAKQRNIRFEQLRSLTFSDILNSLKTNIESGWKISWEISPGFMRWLIFLYLLSGIISPVQILVARQVINLVVQLTKQGQHLFYEAVIWLLFGLGLLLLQNTLSSFKEYILSQFDQEIRFQIADKILQKASELDLAQLDESKVQDTLERAKSNVAPHISRFVSNGFRLFFSGVETIAILIILVVIDPIAAWIMIPIMLPYLLFEWRLGRESYLLDVHFVTARRWLGYLSNLLLSRESASEIKLLNLAPLLIKRYREFSHDMMGQNKSLYRRNLSGGLIFDALFGVGFYGAFGWVVWRVIYGELTVGDIAVYSGAAMRLRNSLEEVVINLTSLLEDAFYVSDLDEFLAIRPDVNNSKSQNFELGVPALKEVKGEIRLENVHFRYFEASTDTLSNINLIIHPGEVIALVGENGAGKTTLAKLISRLYDPTAGRIFFDGVDLRDLDPTWVHRQVAYIMQNFNRYEGTFMENIAFGDWENIMDDTETIEKTAKITELDELINKFPEGYQTVLGRRFGKVDLSSGQWQKLALTRMLVRASRILILDEPSSAMDARAEANLIGKFREFAKGRTTVVISHRFSTVSIADRIVVLDKGRIREMGSHAELMKIDGLYSNLYNLHRHFDMLS